MVWERVNTDLSVLQDDLKKAGEGIVLGLNAVCEGFGNLVEAYQELEDAEDKRSWETVLEGLKAVCDDLGDAKMGALDANQNGEIEEVCISLIIMSQQMSQIGSVDQDQLAQEKNHCSIFTNHFKKKFLVLFSRFFNI